MNKGKFIVFEGPDLSGKTTILNMFYNSLIESKEIDENRIIMTRGLGSNKIGNFFRDIFLNKSIEITDIEKTLAITMALLETSRSVKYYLDQDCIVICDRYIYSFFVYQVKALKYPIANEIFDLIINNRDIVIKPDYLIGINTNLNSIINRSNNRMETNWLDEKEIEFKQELLNTYNRIYQNYNVLEKLKMNNNTEDTNQMYTKFVEIDNSDTLAASQKQIYDFCLSFINDYKNV